MVRTLSHGWQDELGRLVASAEHRLVIAAPFINDGGAALIKQRVSPGLATSGELEVVTDLSPMHVKDGSLSLEALSSLQESVEAASVRHVARLHAKVYLADARAAIVTSGNLTGAAFMSNVEYGVYIDNKSLVEAVCSDFDDIRASGVTLSRQQLQEYAGVAGEVRAADDRQVESADPRLAAALRKAIRDAEDELIRLKLAGGAPHAVFARTIRYILGKHGPLQTPQLHGYVQSMHPDLCDDSIDREIDGKRFGKKWKHAVRTAQQQLKAQGAIQLDGDRWLLVGER